MNSGKTVPRTFSAVVKDSLIWAVNNKGDVDGIIPRNKWNHIETALSSLPFVMTLAGSRNGSN